MPQNSKPSKNVPDRSMLRIKQGVTRDTGLKNFHQVPKKVLKRFLGKIRHHDIMAIAAFAIVNNLDLEEISGILNSINRQKANLIQKDLFNKIGKAIGNLKDKEKEYNTQLGKWNESRRKNEDEQSEQPKEPNFVSFKMDSYSFSGEYTYLSGNAAKKDSAIRSIKGINRQMQLAAYPENRERKGTIYIPLEAIDELGSVSVQVVSNYDTIMHFEIAFDEEGELSITRKPWDSE